MSGLVVAVAGVVLAVLGIVGMLATVDRDEPPTVVVVLFAAGLGLGLLGVVEAAIADERGWSDLTAWAVVLGAAAVLLGFAVLVRRMTRP